jgi:hypothetical protein
MNNNKAQLGLGIAIFLIVIILILTTVILTYVIIKTKVISINTNPTFGQPAIIEEDEEDIIDEFTCNYPYIKVGSSCCLDSNHNYICDSDEKIKQEQQVNVLRCEYPYIKQGISCCIDNNDNQECDKNENDYRNGNNRFRTSLDSPLDIKDIDVYKDELDITIENEENEDVIIKTIDVEDCDRIHPDTTIKGDDDKDFDLDCDFPNIINSDIEVEYTIGNSTDVHTSSGRIREDSYYD